MRIYRMQKSIAGYTIGTGRNAVNDGSLKTSSIVGASIAANRVAARVAKIRIVNAELGMIKNVERFRTEFEDTAFGYLEML